MTNESIKNKIKGLLNIANDGAASEAEIETAMRIAQDWLEKHHLSEEDLVDEPVNQRQEIMDAERGHDYSVLGKRIFSWEVDFRLRSSYTRFGESGSSAAHSDGVRDGTSYKLSAARSGTVCHVSLTVLQSQVQPLK